MWLVAVTLMFAFCVTASTVYADSFSDAEKLANQGDAKAQYELGMWYKYGDSTINLAKDEAKAVEWYEKSANQGYSKAQYQLAGLYDRGTGVAQDHAKAVFWLEKAADQGNAGALYALGIRYQAGSDGVSEDQEKGCALLKAAGDKGHKRALDIYNESCK